MALPKEDWEWLSQDNLFKPFPIVRSFVASYDYPLVSSTGNDHSLIARQWRSAVVGDLQNQVDRLAAHRVRRHEHNSVETICVVDC